MASAKHAQEPCRLLLVLGVDVTSAGRRSRPSPPLRQHEGDGGLDLLRRNGAKDGVVAVGAFADGGPQMLRDQRRREIGPEPVGRHGCHMRRIA